MKKEKKFVSLVDDRAYITSAVLPGKVNTIYKDGTVSFSSKRRVCNNN